MVESSHYSLEREHIQVPGLTAVVIGWAFRTCTGTINGAGNDVRWVTMLCANSHTHSMIVYCDDHMWSTGAQLSTSGDGAIKFGQISIRT